MTRSPSLAIQYDSDLSDRHRARIDYAFRTFCAVYGCTPVDGEADLTLRYGQQASDASELALSVGYVPRDPGQPAPKPTMHSLPELVPAGVPSFSYPSYHTSSAGPDWLGDAFEWISAAHEASVTQVDELGRVPFEQSLHVRDGLDIAVPYAAAAFRGLAASVSNQLGEASPMEPSFGISGGFMVANLHDVDYLSLGPQSTAHRLAKNAALMAVEKDPRSIAQVLRAGYRWAARREEPFGIASVLETEAALGMGSGWAFICRHEHPRDANYKLRSEHAWSAIAAIHKAGAEVAVHGSYESLQAPGRLAEEYALLDAVAGGPIVGGRQHWLRYRGQELYEEMQKAGAKYDASVGYSTAPGYRSGACFAYAPYDFKNERAFPLLELPLAVMDTAAHLAQHAPADAAKLIHRVLDYGRAFGARGISVLWHDTVLTGAQLDRRHGEVFWELQQDGDAWLSGRDVAARLWDSFESAGLVPQWARG